MIQPIPYIGEPATLPLHMIQAEKQIRTRNGFDEESLSQLAATIKEHGVIEPIIVRPDHGDPECRYIVIAGERRLIASSMAGLAEVPVLIRDVPAATAKVLQAIENLQRENLALADVADGVASMMEEYKSLADVAKALGKSKPWTSKMHSLSRAHQDVRFLMGEGLSDDMELFTTLNVLRKMRGEKARATFEKLVDLLRAGSLTRDAARAAVAKLKAPEADADQEEGDGEGEEGNGDSAPVKTSATMRMTAGIAHEMLHALEYTLKHDSPRGFTNAALTALREFMAKQEWIAK